MLRTLCAQVVMFGGQEWTNDKATPIRQSTAIHILDLDVPQLRWRHAPVSNLRAFGLDTPWFPAISAASIPEQNVVVLKYYRVSRWCFCLMFLQHNRGGAQNNFGHLHKTAEMGPGTPPTRVRSPTARISRCALRGIARKV
jgi:hypothetical protein